VCVLGLWCVAYVQSDELLIYVFWKHSLTETKINVQDTKTMIRVIAIPTVQTSFV
jgi:hypothetical protein